MITSYYDEYELVAAKQVSDKELNDLLQEIREKDDRYYLQEKTIVVKNGPWKKQTERKVYTLLLNIGSCECQIVNFCQDHDYSINETVSKSYIMTLFYGWLNGFKHASKMKNVSDQVAEMLDVKDLHAIINPHYDSNGRLDGGLIIRDGKVDGHIDPVGEPGVQGFVGHSGPDGINDTDGKIIIGFEYCENEETLIGPFETEQSFFNYVKNKSKGECENDIIDVKRAYDKKLDWGMDCTFKTFCVGRTIKYGYKFYTNKQTMKLVRHAKYELKPGTVSQFQLECSNRPREIKTVVSNDGTELKFQYTQLSGYITIYEDIEEITVSLD